MLFWLSTALQAAATLSGPTTYDLPSASRSNPLAATARCNDTAQRDDIVVCSTKQDRYRLPLRDEPTAVEIRRTDRQTGMAALAPVGPCGIFVGEQRCNKRDAAEFGYGNGRDPITMLTRIAKKVAGPDAD